MDCSSFLLFLLVAFANTTTLSVAPHYSYGRTISGAPHSTDHHTPNVVVITVPVVISFVVVGGLICFFGVRWRRFKRRDNDNKDENQPVRNRAGYKVSRPLHYQPIVRQALRSFHWIHEDTSTYGEVYKHMRRGLSERSAEDLRTDVVIQQPKATVKNGTRPTVWPLVRLPKMWPQARLPKIRTSKPQPPPRPARPASLDLEWNGPDPTPHTYLPKPLKNVVERADTSKDPTTGDILAEDEFLRPAPLNIRKQQPKDDANSPAVEYDEQGEIEMHREHALACLEGRVLNGPDPSKHRTRKEMGRALTKIRAESKMQ